MTFPYTQLGPKEVDFVPVAAVSELPNGERIFVEIDNETIVVFNIAGKYFAIGDVCSHDDGPVGEGVVADMQIECPRHGARFDLAPGKVLSLPAAIDIPAYPVRVVGDEIQVGFPAE